MKHSAPLTIYNFLNKVLELGINNVIHIIIPTTKL